MKKRFVGRVSDDQMKSNAQFWVRQVLLVDMETRRKGMDDDRGATLSEQRVTLGPMLTQGNIAPIIPAFTSFLKFCSVNFSLPAQQMQQAFNDLLKGVVQALDCRFGAVIEVDRATHDAAYAIDPGACEGCGVCVRLCPIRAIDFPERLCGEWMMSGTRCGPMVHAQLGVAAENSGKLVSAVREMARLVAEQETWSVAYATT